MRYLTILLFSFLCTTSLANEVNNTNTLDISFIVIVENDYAYVRNLLRSLTNIIKTEKKTYEILVKQSKFDYFEAESLRNVCNMFSNTKFLGTSAAFQTKEEKEKYGSLARIYNDAAESSKGQYIFFLSDNTDPNLDFILPLVQELERNQNIGVIAPLLLNANEATLYSSGLDFVMGPVSKPSLYSWDSNTENDKPVPYFPYQGYSVYDSRIYQNSNVMAVSRSAFMVEKTLYQNIGGMNTNFTEGYFELDFFLKVAQNEGKIIKTESSSKVVVFDTGIEKKSLQNNYKDLIYFNSIWGEYLTKKIVSEYSIQNLTLKWNMECGAGQVLGFTTEAIGFLNSLEKKIDMRVEVSNLESCQQELNTAGFPSSVIDRVTRLASKQKNEDWYSVLVIHRDPGRYSQFIGNRYSAAGKDDYLIGRSMYETNKIPDHWVEPCNETVDEIWVPSQFNIDTFSNAGIPKEKLFKITEPIDTNVFDCQIVESLNLPTKKKFNFLSIGKWEERKGWDILIGAYANAFDATDDVVLTVRSHLDSDNLEFYNEFVSNLSRTLDKTLPQIQIFDEILPSIQIPSLFKTANAFILSSHGEGWGLPLAEAMSMEIPVVATNWSGNTEFMTEENSYLIPVEKLVETNIDEGHLWAKANQTELEKILKSIYQNYPKAQEKSKIALHDMKSKYSLEATAEKVLNRLKEIIPNIPTAKAEREQKEVSLNNWNQNNWGFEGEIKSQNEEFRVLTGSREKIKMKVLNDI